MEDKLRRGPRRARKVVISDSSLPVKMPVRSGTFWGIR